MGRWRRTTACERATQWLSLQLDGEIGELERDGLARHLARCEQCSALGVELGGFTALVRAAPAVARQPRASRTGEPPARRGAARRAAVAGVLAATIAAGAALVYLPRSATTWVSTPGFASTHQQLEFARDRHVRIEPSESLPLERPLLQVPGSRALY